ncbi:PP2C family protein-serine/threonine phosphatase [Tindallia californiensis]|uniref:Protein phosphatase n=1 Tax=Tindallia californiensis TaxID=159292 RepID=A0A1H3Q5B0_9FIRM|nr:protein phosphatase 2C domain-containing protein [Tindallia californiensis]SDZ08371.1 protein phosphatase [Tindallia californiensis]
MNNNPITVQPYNAQHLGTRKEQEDAFGMAGLTAEGTLGEKGFVAVLADGMGGMAFGNLASNTAVNIFLREYENKKREESADSFLIRTSKIANTAVFDKAYVDGEEVEMGTTLVAVMLSQQALYWVTAGDSHLYHYRKGQLQRLNHDHIYGNELQEEVINGNMTQKEAENHPEHDYLTSYLGLPEIPELDMNQTPLSLEGGDQLLLCSDGLDNVLTSSDIKETLEAEMENPAEALVQQVFTKNKRHLDNITAIVLKIIS